MLQSKDEQQSPRQSVTHAHWILGSPRKTEITKRCSLLQFLAQVSRKSLLKFQVGIISLRVVFRESRGNTKSPFPMDLRQLRWISSTATRRLTCLSVSRSRILETSQRLKATVLAYAQNSSVYFYYCFETRNEKACMSLVVFGTKIWKSLTQTHQRLGVSLRSATEDNLDFVNCRYNENYEQVKTSDS